jgi:hypothetical protein|nr:MAG TPA: hypothetical protein [Caudoviricetes sp.]
MTEKQQLTLNQENMIKLALMYEDYDLEKMLEKLMSIGLAHSTASLYIKEYYRNLYKRIRSELKTLLDCVTYEEVFTRSYKVYDTWNTMENISTNLEMGFVKINDIDEKEVKEICEQINQRVKEVEKDTDELVNFYKSL